MSSLLYYVGLLGAPPPVEQLDAELAGFGGIEGDWQQGIVCAEITATVLDDEHAREVIANALDEDPPVGFTTIIELDGESSDALFALGEALVARGGAFVSEDGEVIEYEVEGSAPEPAPQVPLDVSIPDDVQRLFGTTQKLYKLAARTSPSGASFAALVKALDSKPGRVGFGHGWEQLELGQLVLREHSGMNLAHFAPELDAIGIDPRDRVFSLTFEYWHTTSVSDENWSAMLAVICGLGRLTSGVLYRPGTDGGAHDFG